MHGISLVIRCSALANASGPVRIPRHRNPLQKEGSMTESQEPQLPLRLGSKASWLAYVAQQLGYFNDENLAVTLLNKQEIKDLEAGGGRLDAQVNWFQHAVFG